MPPNGPTDPPNPVHVVIGAALRTVGPLRQLLVTQRPHHVPLAAHWELPGGKIQPGESHHDALRREFLEELNLTIEVGPPLATIRHQYPHASVILHCYLCRLTSGQPRNLHVIDHRWVTAPQLATLSFPPANADLMRRLAQHLASPDAPSPSSPPPSPA